MGRGGVVMLLVAAVIFGTGVALLIGGERTFIPPNPVSGDTTK